MKNLKVKAFVLQSFNYLDNCKRLELISEDNQVISALYYKSKKAQVLPVPSMGIYYLTKNKEQSPYTIKEVDIQEDYEFIYKDLSILKTYQSWVVLLNKIKDKTFLFDTLTLCTLYLKDYNNQKVNIFFHLNLLMILGYSFDLYTCPICSKEYKDDQMLYYNFNLLTNCCSNCSNNKDYLYLPKGARKYLKLFLEYEAKEVFNIDIKDEILNSINNYMIRYVNQLQTLQ